MLSVRRNIFWICGALLVGCFAGYSIVLNAIPYIVSDRMKDFFEEVAEGENVIFNAKRLGARPTHVPRTNPDIITSMCVIDTQDGPVYIADRVWKDYWSVSLYDRRGDNIFVVNNDDVDQDVFQAIISREPMSTEFGDSIVLDEGVMIIRRIVLSQEDYQHALAWQSDATCEPWSGRDFRLSKKK